MGSGEGAACDIGWMSPLNAAQRRRFQDPQIIRRIIAQPGTVAVVGLSANPQKASYFVADYLQKRGWRIIPVTPKSGTILGETSFASLEDIPVLVDLVDVFRPPLEMPALVEQAIRIRARAFWMQLKLAHLEAAETAAAAGLLVVADKCIKMEYGRYNGGLNSAGMNSGVISSKKNKA